MGEKNHEQICKIFDFVGKAIILQPLNPATGCVLHDLRRFFTMKKQIVICMGSSCFSRGNDRNLEIIESFLAEHQMQDQVDLRGSRCEERCDRGPILKIDEKIFTHANQADILKILRDNLFTEE